MTRMAGGQKTVISWQDAPDDLFFRATAAAKKVVISLEFSVFLFNFNADEETVDRGCCQTMCSQTLQKNPLKYF